MKTFSAANVIVYNIIRYRGWQISPVQIQKIE